MTFRYIPCSGNVTH